MPSNREPPPTDATVMADLVASLNALKTSVEELRKNTAESQAQIRDLSHQVEAIPIQSRDSLLDTSEANNFLTPMSTNLVLPGSDMTRLYDLPTFSGTAEEWPLFFASFEDTTETFKYSHRQNLMRLQKSLVGAAREAVVSMLIYPSEVPKIMDELQFTFGRPEHMVRYQLNKMKAVPIIPENKIEQILTFSTKVRNVVSFLRASKCERHLADPNLLDEIVGKMPMSKQYEWVKYSLDIKPYASIEHFSEWLSTLARIISKMPPAQQSTSRIPAQVTQRRVMYTKENTTRDFKCCHCEGSHKLVNCEQFRKELSVDERWSKVKANQLCFSCLNKGHSSPVCRSKRLCGISGCRRFHHPSLHEETPKSRINVQPILNCDTPDDNGQLFKILPVSLYGPTGKMDAFAMFDEGSAISLLEEEVALRLGLKGQREPLKLQWYGQKITTEESRRVSLDIEGMTENQRFNIKNIRTIKNLDLPAQSFRKSDYSHLEFLPLQEYAKARPVLLLGLDYVYLSASTTIVESGHKKPIAAKTKLGWVAYGPAKATTSPLVLHIRQKRDTDLHQIVAEYISTENFGSNESFAIPESTENIRARKTMEETTRKVGKHFEIGLLWKEFMPTLPDSFSMALKRLVSLEKKMSREPEFAERYRHEIQKYMDNGYAKKLSKDEISNTDHPIWYLPHFAVQNPHKPNKVRIVFDAAATINGISLNSVLSKGPEQAKPLIGILFQFRQDVIGVAADIREMFSQVHIIPDDQHAQRFLWRDGDPKKPIQQYAMVSMIFGAVCSPCCAEWIKNINARQFEDMYPEAAAAVIDKHYVDDFVCSFSTEEQAERICKQVSIINAEAGFHLRNFVSNSSKLQASMNGEVTTESKVNMERQATSEKILGMFWDTTTDTFRFETKFHRITHIVLESLRSPTKRELLGIVMAVYDPFGFLADFLIFSKILVQECWKGSVDWDDPIPAELNLKWIAWWNEFKQVKAFQIPRCHSPNFSLSNANIELHIFVDASQIAFAAVGYFRIDIDNYCTDLSFVAGKTRTAPKKLMSIPRLELQAAILGLRLSKTIIKSHEVRLTKITFWTDSRTVLYWIHSHERKYKPFVGHRISEIISNTNPNQWRWVPTTQNSADTATRPKFPPKFQTDSRWIKGPDFLKENEGLWPEFHIEKTKIATEEEIHTKTFLCCQASRPLISFNNFSSYFKMKRVCAWVVRFAKMLKAKIYSPQGHLTAADMIAAEYFICRTIQSEEYHREIVTLKEGKPIPKSSSIYALTPYLDPEGLLRLHGRLDEALCLPYSARRPIIIPQNHAATKLIVQSFHERYHHQNAAVIINQIRQTFWIPRIKIILKDVTKNCPRCKIDRAIPNPPLMGQLPTDRVTPYVRPFTYTGVDLFGPLNVTIGRRREKRWVVIFTCLTIRAAHFEIAENLTTDAFIICLRNFINRRGTPVSIRCDNGTNFIGAQKELKKNECLLDTDRIIDESTKHNVAWIFNCPANPSSGGCWERLIKIVKLLFLKTLKEEAPRVETLRCALLEAENIINSRPLTEIPLSSEQDEPITPNHFLLGCVNSTQTPHPVDLKVCLQKQWRIAQNLKDRLWKRWVVEYLPQLLRRSKWHDKPPPLKVNDLVIICDPGQPRSQWQKGRITKVIPAKDGHIRIAEVKTATALLKRPANKLAVLSIRGES